MQTKCMVCHSTEDGIYQVEFSMNRMICVKCTNKCFMCEKTTNNMVQRKEFDNLMMCDRCFIEHSRAPLIRAITDDTLNHDNPQCVGYWKTNRDTEGAKIELESGASSDNFKTALGDMKIPSLSSFMIDTTN